MCGIASFFYNAPAHQERAQQTVDSMLDRISHRGFRSLKASTTVGRSAMGCVRLPVRDPIGGQQPAFNEDHSVAALLNGEIYNCKALFNFRRLGGNSDTAMLPYLYRSSAKREPDLRRLLSCRGMYAIILHDLAADVPTARILRDHIGIKPLFMARSPEGFLFASEEKAFPRSVSSSVLEVGPGRLLTLVYKDGEWIHLLEEDVRSELQAGPDALPSLAAASLRTIISKAVTAQLPDEKLPLAVLCSGGIDSSIVTYELASQLASHPSAGQTLTAYTAHCSDSLNSNKGDDQAAAQALCKLLRVPLREVQITYDDLFNVLADVIYHVESFEPNLVRNAAIQYHIMRQIAADGFRVAFCGEGADELFWGYADFADAADPSELSARLVADLHRTQLQRVDRIGMAHTVEVRVPLLDESVVSFSQRVPSEAKLLTICGIWLGKKILREAYAETFPDQVVLRRKATLAYGVGFGGVEMNDEPMNSRSKRLLEARGLSTDSVYRRFPSAFPPGVPTAELALYVYLYDKLGFTIPAVYLPPNVAKLERPRQ